MMRDPVGNPTPDEQGDGSSPIPETDAQDVVRLLLAAGEELDPSVRERILASADAVVPALIGTLEDDSLAHEESPGGGWAPIHAADLLGALKAQQAIPSLLRFVMVCSWDAILYNSAVAALKSYGTHAYTPVMQAFQKNRDPDKVTVLTEIMADLGHRNEELYQVLLGMIPDHPEQAAMDLAAYGDARALPTLFELYDGLELSADDAFRSADTIYEIAAAICDLGGELSAAQQAKRERADMERRQGAAEMLAYLKTRDGKAATEGQSRRLGRNRHFQLSQLNFCATAETVTDDMIRAYGERHQGRAPDSDLWGRGAGLSAAGFGR